MALSDTSHVLAEVETVERGGQEAITFVHVQLSNGRQITISSDSGADLAIEEA